MGNAGPWASPGAAAQRPPRLLLTLLGDYWWQRTESLPSAAIVALLAEFGVSDSAARAALSRLTRNGLLVTSKSGRRTFSRLSSRAAAILDDGARRIFSFGAANQPWDGMWSLVAFSIPEDNRAARDALRKQLRWLGFAPLYDGLWLSPRDHAAEVIGYLKDLDITTATAFRASSVPAECDIPARAWDLDGLRAQYERFVAFARQLRDTTAAGQVPPMDALIARTTVMDEWRAFPGLDPDLPAELLPSAWPRAQARELFIGCYDLLGPLAARRVRQIIARYSPDLAGRAAYHSSELKLSAAPDPASALGLAADAAERVYLGGLLVRGRIGPPARARDHAGFHQFKAVEEAGDLLGRALHVRDRAAVVVVLRGLLDVFLADDAGAVVERQVAAGRQGAHQAAYHGAGLVDIHHVAQDAAQDQRDGPAEVQRVGRLGHDLVRFTQVGVDIGGGALGGAGQQGARVGQHQGVVIDIDDAGLGRYPLRDLMGVVGRGQAGADVEELPDARVLGQVMDAAGQEAP
jgi:phenylacetic acid degradation operon negative regulatory protein